MGSVVKWLRISYERYRKWLIIFVCFWVSGTSFGKYSANIIEIWKFEGCNRFKVKRYGWSFLSRSSWKRYHRWSERYNKRIYIWFVSHSWSDMETRNKWNYSYNFLRTNFRKFCFQYGENVRCKTLYTIEFMEWDAKVTNKLFVPVNSWNFDTNRAFSRRGRNRLMKYSSFRLTI